MLKTKLLILFIFLLAIFSNSFNSVDGSQLQNSRVINVSIQGFAFSPASIDVNVGENITFNVTNFDSASHTFTITNSTFNVDIELIAGQTKEVQFIAPSNSQSIGFKCRFHSSMTGTITVSDPSSSSESSSSSSPSSSSSMSTTLGSSTYSTTSQASLELYTIISSLVLLGIINWRKKKF